MIYREQKYQMNSIRKLHTNYLVAYILLTLATTLFAGNVISGGIDATNRGFHYANIFMDSSWRIILASGDGSLNESLLQHLIARKGTVHLRDERALKCAAEEDFSDIIRLLVRYGADLHNNQEEALRLAILRGNVAAVETLLELGANGHVPEETPLLLAVRNNNDRIVELLLTWSLQPGNQIYNLMFINTLLLQRMQRYYEQYQASGHAMYTIDDPIINLFRSYIQDVQNIIATHREDNSAAC